MFSDPRGPDVPGLIKPTEFYPFLGVLGALGPIFRKKIIFRVKIIKMEIYGDGMAKLSYFGIIIIKLCGIYNLVADSFNMVALSKDIQGRIPPKTFVHL